MRVRTGIGWDSHRLEPGRPLILGGVTLEHPDGLDEAQRAERHGFTMQFQQLTGPVMAKGMEDTAFYRYYPLASLNEVGGSPERFGTSAAFSVFVPALIIILIGLTGLWVPPARVDVRSATGAPMLAAAVLFHYSLMQSLPATGYLTRADKVMLGLLKDLYHGPYDAKELVILQELFEMVEQAVDRCRNAGNIVVQIVLKHS